MIVLLNTSKTMTITSSNVVASTPTHQHKALELDHILKTYSVKKLQTTMHLSPALAQKTYTLIRDWSINPQQQSPALDAFIGDIFTGVNAPSLSPSDRSYAQENLRIVSGLYGLLRPLDGIMPYRLEMCYRLKGKAISLYSFWGDTIVKQLPNGLIVNLASVEYAKAFKPYLAKRTIIEPQFLTLMPGQSQPKFVALHAKIARGAFARWLIQTKNTDPNQMEGFNLLGYSFDPHLSTSMQPAFIRQGPLLKSHITYK